MLTKIIREDGTTELANIKTCTFTEQVNADTDLRVGCVASASIEVTAFGGQTDAPTAGEELTYYQVDGEGNETKIGIFYAEPSITTKDSYSFVAYDAVKKLDADFSEHLSSIQSDFPMTIMDIVEEAAQVADVTLVSGLSFPLSSTSVNAFSMSGITCRQILSWAAEIAGRFVRCNADGEIEFAWYVASNDVIAPSDENGAIYYKQDGLQYENYTTTALARVAVYQINIDSLAYVYPANVTSGNTYDVSGNMLLLDATEATYLSVAQNIYGVLTALGTYRPFNVQLFPFNNPFRAGDKISVTDSQGVTFTTLIMGMAINDNSATLYSTGGQEYTNDSSNLNSTIIALTENASRTSDTNQYFWFLSSGEEAGAHITQVPRDNFIANPQGGNTLINADGLIVRYGTTEMALFTNDYARIGQTDKSRVIIDDSSFEMYYGNETEPFVKFLDLRNADGYVDITEQFIGDGEQRIFTVNNSVYSATGVKVNDVSVSYACIDNTFRLSQAPQDGAIIEISYKTQDELKSYTLGKRDENYNYGGYSIAFGIDTKSTGWLSYAEGHGAEASGNWSHAEGHFTHATGQISHAEGRNTTASSGNSHAEGYSTTASGHASHSEGQNTTASGICSHAEGQLSDASGNTAHAEGNNTTASGHASHSEGQDTTASGNWSHASGRGTIASGQDQTAIGTYNVSDQTGGTLFLIGAGSDDNNRKTVFSVNTSGNTNMGAELKMKNSDNVSADITAYSGGQYGTNLVINPKGNLILGGGEYAQNRYNATLTGSTTEYTYIGADEVIVFESNGNTIANAKKWTLNTNGNWVAGATAQGVFGVDSSGFEYPFAYDNGTNLWIGATTGSSKAHTGQTVISSGHNGTSGNATIYVSVPNAGNTGGTSYGVYHTGYKPTLADLGLNNSVSNKDFTAVSIATSTHTTLGNTGSLSAGTYILKASGNFASNATGRRMVYLTTNSSTGNTNTANNRYMSVVQPTASGGDTILQVTYIVTISSATTFYLRAWQNSGSALSCTGGVQVLKIH